MLGIKIPATVLINIQSCLNYFSNTLDFCYGSPYLKNLYIYLVTLPLVYKQCGTCTFLSGLENDKDHSIVVKLH